MADAVDRLAGLPDELVLAIFAECAPTQLCAIGSTCQRLKAISRDDHVWRRCHTARWRHPHQAVAPPPGWRADFARRHVQDARVVGLLRSLKQSDARASEVAWSLLLDLGMEVFDEVLRLADAGEEEAENALLGLNQAAVRAEWHELVRRADAPAAGEAAPHVEDGALLLVRFYEEGVETLRTPGAAAAEVSAELDAMAARLDARLPPTRAPVEVVKELAEMMFKSEGFKGNEEDYYAASNSLLDHVLRARTGIPISLSVVFAAVCRRVGVVLDAIGLPGHFLLGIKGSAGIFVDVFHHGTLLDLAQCQAITRSYGIPWSDEMVTPVPVSEVWARQVRNLLNCFQKKGDLAQSIRLQALLSKHHRRAVLRPGTEAGGLLAAGTDAGPDLQRLLSLVLQMGQ